MYSIYAGDLCIYDDTVNDKNLKVLNPTLKLADSSAGSLEMTVPYNNVGYSVIEKMKTNITVKQNNVEIWAGRPLNDGANFIKQRKIYCEGELAYLNDTTQPPSEYHDITVQGFFEALVAVHNSKVDASRQFVVGSVTVTDPNNSLYRYTNYEKTIQCINEKLIKVYGGHLVIRKVNGVRYLDYLAEYPNTNTQTIEFGKNLLDFTTSEDMSEYATVILPLGKRLETSPIEALEAYTTVKDVNDGSPYVQSNSALLEYGWIEKVVSWNDVTEPSNLMTKSNLYLTDTQFINMVIQVNAIDLHYMNIDTESIKMLDLVQVISIPHGMDRYFPVSELVIPLANPENTVFTMGNIIKRSLTDVNNKINSELMAKIDALPKKSEILQDAISNATSLIASATNGFITIVHGPNGSEEQLVTDNVDYKAATKVWRWDINGLGYSSTGYDGPYGLALTMDGGIVASMITTGVLNANLLRAGVIRSLTGESYWDLNTGEVHFVAIEQSIQQNTNDIATINEDLSAFSIATNNSLQDLQNQVDGSITTWFLKVPPTTNNAPAIEWTTITLKNNHLGDLYYDTITGYCYRYQVVNDVYNWQRITDTDVTKALSDAANAQDTADSKRRVFTVTPFVPYDAGDLWMQGTSGDIMKCSLSRVIGSYNASDWDKASKYTDDTAVNNLQIGGRNIAEQTNQGMTNWAWGMQTGGYTKTSVMDNGVNCCSLVRDAVAQTGYSVILYSKIGRQKYESNTNYTISFDVKCSVGGNITMNLLDADGTDSMLTATASGSFTANTWSKVSGTVKTLSTLPTSIAQYLYLTQMPSGTGVTYLFKNVKIEKGSKATDWTPAPEDISADIVAAKTYAETKADEAKSAAQAYALAQSEATEVAAAAYADNIVTTAEQNAIDVANANLATAKTYAEIKATDAKNASLAYTDALKIGGRNFVTDSSFELSKRSTKFISHCGITYPVGNNDTRCIALSRLTSDDCWASLTMPVLPPGEYTVSIDIKSDADIAILGTFIFRGYTSGFVTYVNTSLATTISSSWTRYSRTFTITTANTWYELILRPPVTIGGGIMYYDNIQIEAGNKATAWTPALEDVNDAIASSLASAKTYADSTASAAQTAAQSYAVSKANLAETNANAYADGVITDEEAARIAAAAADLNTAKNYADTKKAESLTAAQGYVDALKIGGRNLFLETSSMPGKFTNDASGAATKGTIIVQSDGSALITNTNSNYRFFYAGSNIFPCVGGEVYTVSAMYKYISGSPSPMFQITSNGNVQSAESGTSEDVGNGWIKKYYTFTIPIGTTAASFGVCLRSGTDYTLYTHQYYIKNPKLEKGNKATDWTPAPEDIEQKINDSKFEFTNLVGCTAVGNVITKTGVQGDWNSGFSNTYKFYNGDSIEFKTTNPVKHIIVGFSNGDTNAHYTSISFALYLDTNGINVFESGATAFYLSAASWSVTDVFAIMIVDNKIKYYRNGVCIYTSLKVPTLPLVLDSSIYDNGGNVIVKLGMVDNLTASTTTAQSSANTANTAITEITSDTKLTPLEKQTIRKEWDTIYGEYSGNLTQATNFTISTEKTNYTNALTTLGTYLNGGTAYVISSTIPLWINDANLNAVTTIVPATFRNSFVTFYDVRQLLLNAMTTKAKGLADTAQNTVNNLQIGGRNIIPHSAFETLVPGDYEVRDGVTYAVSVDSTNKYDNYNSLKIVGNAAGVTGTKDIIQGLTKPLKVGDKYILSFWARSSVPCILYVRSGYYISQVPACNITTSWQKYTVMVTDRNTENNTLVYWFNIAATAWVSQMKCEEGNKATDWSPAPEDLIELSNTAQATADTAIVNAQTANTAISDIASDTKLTPSEKHTIRKEWDTLYGEYDALRTQADAFGIVTEKNNYANNALSLGLYLNNNIAYIMSATPPSWITDVNLGVTTGIVGATFRSKFAQFYNVRQLLLNAISAKAKSLADIAQNTVNTLKVGGTNILRNTSKPTGSENLVIGANSYSAIYNDTEKGPVFERSTISTTESYILTSRTPKVEFSTQYTLSFDVYVNSYVKNLDVFWLSDTESNKKIGDSYVNSGYIAQSINPLVNKWQRLSYTFTTRGDDYTGFVRIDNNGSSSSGTAAILRVTNLKLEKGNRGSEWSPAPEDVQGNIDAKATSTKIISIINQTAESIKISATHLDLNGYVTITDLETSGSTEINGDNVTTGNIKSANYQVNVSGTKISLTTGEWDSKNFRVSSDGTITATAGKIGLWTIDTESTGLIYHNANKGVVGGQKFLEMTLGEVTNTDQYNISTTLTPYDLKFSRVYPYGKGPIAYEVTDYTSFDADGLHYWHNGSTMSDHNVEVSVEIKSTLGYDGFTVTSLNFTANAPFRFNYDIDATGYNIWGLNLETKNLVKGKDLVCTNGLTAYYNATQAVFFGGSHFLTLYQKGIELGWW